LGVIDKKILSMIPVILDKEIMMFKNMENEEKFELIKTTDYYPLDELYCKILK